MSPCWLIVLLCSSPLWQTEGVEGWGISTVPSESECRPYIEKALKEHTETPQEAVDATGSEHEAPPSPSTDQEGSIEETEEATTKESIEEETGDEAQVQDGGESTETGERDEESTEEDHKAETETASEEGLASTEETATSTETTESQEGAPGESTGEDAKGEESAETEEVNEELGTDQKSVEGGEESAEVGENSETTSTEGGEELEGEQSAETPDEGTTEDKTEDEETQSTEETQESTEQDGESLTEDEEQQDETKEEGATGEEISAEETKEETLDTTESEEKPEPVDEVVESTEHVESQEEDENTGGEVTDSPEAAESTETEETKAEESAEAGAGEVLTESIEETAETTEASTEDAAPASVEDAAPASVEETSEDTTPVSTEETSETPTENTEEGSAEEITESVEGTSDNSSVEKPTEDTTESSAAEEQPTEKTSTEADVASETIEATPTSEGATEGEPESSEQSKEQEESAEGEAAKEAAPTVEDQLSLEFEVPKVRRQREHISEILKLTPESAEVEMLLAKTIESTLKELKKLYDSAIKPLEILYKYRDLSNRHFGDPEIFSKPLILFMGPWSGGKSTIINYLLDNEFQASSLRTGAEPSPAYFNILMWGEREEVLDGTQLAADWTFSGLQKFGQGLLDRLRGLKLNNPLLEKVNIVEIPGILEIRKQVERLFPFNDACQWFIDRADIIFLVYDPSKLDVGPETEAILDQLKGREYQTRIILNKADQVKPEELMRVQGTLIWNISPLMSSQEPPILYSTSLWSVPYEQGAPTRLLHAQERAFLRDLRAAVDKRVENKIASARRFAVRVRNHAKMVDCYLTTYYNHKTFFGNRKKVADDIIEHPQNYHIYEGLSTLTNISRYDLPDPEVYRDFFRLNPVYDFQRLSDTCTYFRGCPINRLDVAIAYDLPELVGKYKKQAERVLEAAAAQAGKS